MNAEILALSPQFYKCLPRVTAHVCVSQNSLTGETHSERKSTRTHTSCFILVMVRGFRLDLLVMKQVCIMNGTHCFFLNRHTTYRDELGRMGARCLVLFFKKKMLKVKTTK